MKINLREKASKIKSLRSTNEMLETQEELLDVPEDVMIECDGLVKIYKTKDIDGIYTYTSSIDNKTYIGQLFSTEEYMKKTIFLDMGDYYFVGNDINDNSLRFRKSHIKSIKLVEGSDK